MILGFYLGIIAIAIWSMLDVMSRVAVTTISLNPLVFSCVNLMIGGIALVALSGGTHSLKATLYDKFTWTYGLLRVLKTILLVSAMVYITATVSIFAMRIEILLTMGAAWLLLNRQPEWREVPGIIVFIIGWLLIWQDVPAEARWPGMILTALAAIVGMAMYLIAERHPVNNRVLGWRERAGFTGMMLLVTAAFFWVLSFTLFGGAEFLGLTPPADTIWSNLVPRVEDFFNPAVWIFGGLVGLVLRAPSMHLQLLATRLLKAELIAIVSLIGSFAIIGYESVLGWFDWVDATTLTPDTIIASLIMLAGALWLMAVRMHRRIVEDKEERMSQRTD